MEKQYVHKAIVFNLANPYHRKIYNWLTNETANISGFLFQTLAMRFEGWKTINQIDQLEVDTDLINEMLGE